jgi:acyl-coenzyme A thioesterase PaaI-like protein
VSDEETGSARRAFAGGEDLDPGPGGGHPGVDGEATSAAADLPINQVAAALRRIGAVTIGQPLDDDDLSAAGARLAEVADQLEAAAAASKRKRRTPGQAGFPGVHPQDHFPTSPMIGYANPISPPVEVWAVLGEDGQREIRGRVTFDYPFEGPPTCVHGGVIAELFDEVLGATNIIAGNPGMTGTLTVKYRKPTPLLTDLRIEARCLGWSGRKIRTWGAIFAGDVLTAEAEGIFIAVRPEMMLAIAEGNEAVADPDIVAAIKAETNQAISARDAYRAAKAANAARAGGT